MKLAEALQERADMNLRLSNLEHRLCANALVQEGEPTAEDPASLMAEFNADADRLEALTSQINKTNCAVRIGGETLTDLLARRDVLRQRLSAYRNLVNNASMAAARARQSEIKIVRTVDVRALQSKCDAMAAELRRVDNTIQAANWQFDLIE